MRTGQRCWDGWGDATRRRWSGFAWRWRAQTPRLQPLGFRTLRLPISGLWSLGALIVCCGAAQAQSSPVHRAPASALSAPPGQAPGIGTGMQPAPATAPENRPEIRRENRPESPSGRQVGREPEIKHGPTPGPALRPLPSLGSLAALVPPLVNSKRSVGPPRVEDMGLLDENGRIPLELTGQPPPTTKLILEPEPDLEPPPQTLPSQALPSQTPRSGFGRIAQ